MFDNKGPMVKDVEDKYLTNEDSRNKRVGQENYMVEDSVTLVACASSKETVAAVSSLASGLGASPLILLAEDNEFTAETMRDYLCFHDFRVNHARNGYEVIEQALADQPDLIIMDIQMPGLNGFEATQRLRTYPLTAKTPIIALTALAMSGDRERCLNAGANAYFSKPLSLRQLLDTIRLFLTGAY